MEILLAVATKVAEYTVDLIVRGASAIFKPQSTIQETCVQREKLQVVHDNLENRCREAMSKGEEIIEEINQWLEDTKAALEEVDKWMHNSGVNKQNTSTYAWICTSKWVWAHKQRKNAIREKEKLCEMIEREKLLKVISRRIPATGMTLLSVDGFIVFKSVGPAFDEIMRAITMQGQRVIGIYGMGGVGKTALVKRAIEEVERNKLVSKVVVTMVSQTPNVHKIQADLGEQLGMTYTMETENGRATQLSNRMNHEENILVVLDDVWRKIDLATIGIPIGHKGCKVLVSSRLKQVCRSMGCDNLIKLSLLDDEESLDLFKKHANTTFIDDPQLEAVQNELVRECDNLPLALVVVASALKDKSKKEWEFALRSIQNSSLMEMENIDENLYARIKLSYDFIKAETTKKCFLICSLFPEDSLISIEALTEYAVGYGLFDEDNTVQSYQNAEDQVRIKIDYLLSYNLLSRPYPMLDDFKMHDIVRDAVLWITSKGEVSKGEEVFLVQTPSQKNWTKDNKKLVDATAISLVDCPENQHLQSLTECARLKMLLMNQKKPLPNVPYTFFNSLTSLQVLDISAEPRLIEKLPTKMSFRYHRLELPSSFQHLCNLRTLHLRRWRLVGDMSIIGSLTKLEILGFAGSAIDKLPSELLKLTELKFVDLSTCLVLDFDSERAIIGQLSKSVERFYHR